MSRARAWDKHHKIQYDLGSSNASGPFHSGLEDFLVLATLRMQSETPVGPSTVRRSWPFPSIPSKYT